MKTLIAQTEQLQQIDADLDELHANINRAKREMRKFALGVLKSKLMIIIAGIIIILIVIAVVAVICLSGSVGKTLKEKIFK